MKQEKLSEILHKHKLWLEGDPDGIKADLRGADLRYSDLNGADLRYSDLSGANLTGADLRGADLRYSNLSWADLRGANLREADLNGADLRYSNLSGAELSGAEITNVKANHTTTGYHLACPEEGTFIGFKKTREGVVKLEVSADALRSSATTRKCRCSKAKVLELPEGVTEAHSRHDNSFVYRLGEVVEVKDFDTDRWNECSQGIHFFMTRAEAEAWSK